MDSPLDYSIIIEAILREYAHKPSHGDIEPELVIDREKGHYELMFIGWDQHRRVHGSVLHIDLKGNKVWIQHDGTQGVAKELVAAGIPKDQIVLGFRPKKIRQHTGYAVE